MKTINKTKKQLKNKLEETKRRVTLLKTSANRDDNTEALLQQSEEKYKAIFNSVNDILILTNK